jgi:hypothetical protein
MAAKYKRRKGKSAAVTSVAEDTRGDSERHRSHRTTRENDDEFTKICPSRRGSPAMVRDYEKRMARQNACISEGQIVAHPVHVASDWHSAQVDVAGALNGLFPTLREANRRRMA